MFKRVIWMGTGASVGFGASLWMQRKVKRTVQRYTPQRVTGDFVEVVRDFGYDLRDAVAEGRIAMAQREAELRAELAARQR